MKTISKSLVLAVSILCMTGFMQLGVTVQEWTSFLHPLPILNRALLVGAAGLSSTFLGIGASAHALRNLLYHSDLRIISEVRLITVFSLSGFGVGLTAYALTLLIWIS